MSLSANTTLNTPSYRSFDWRNPIEATWLRRHLCDGGILLCAAEHLWGLSCDATHPKAVERLVTIKQRSQQKGLIIASSQRRHFAMLIQSLTEEKRQMIDRYWNNPHAPPTTFIFPDPDQIFPPWVGCTPTTHNQIQTIAARICHTGPIAALSALIDTPLVTTSANISNHPSPKNLSQAKHNFLPFAQELPIVGDNPPKGPPSQIFDIRSGKKIR